MPDRKDVLEHYEEYKKKHKLPELEEVEEILSAYIDERSNYLHTFLTIMNNMFNLLYSQIISIIEPADGARYIIESGFYDKKQKKELFERSNWLLGIHYELAKGIYSGDKAKAEIFKKYLKVFKNELMPFASRFFGQLSEKWAKDSKKKEKPSESKNYFG